MGDKSIEQLIESIKLGQSQISYAAAIDDYLELLVGDIGRLMWDYKDSDAASLRDFGKKLTLLYCDNRGRSKVDVSKIAAGKEAEAKLIEMFSSLKTEEITQ